MTRINCVPVSELCRQHLVAEYRELPRVYALARMALQRNEKPEDHPSQYNLGKGHVRFFYSRLAYVASRHQALVDEMLSRGYVVNFPSVPDLKGWPPDWLRDWRPDEQALEHNRARIKERLIAKRAKEKRN
jgi:hypothetical protein